MTATATALLGYVAWTILLVTMLASVRTLAVQTAGRAANSFSPSGEDLEGFGRRLTRAHANCYENLPIAGAVLLYAIATGQTALTDPLAPIFLAARLLQSIVHMASTSNNAVLVRFILYIVQMVILVWWLLKLAGIL